MQQLLKGKYPLKTQCLFLRHGIGFNQIGWFKIFTLVCFHRFFCFCFSLKPWHKMEINPEKTDLSRSFPTGWPLGHHLAKSLVVCNPGTLLTNDRLPTKVITDLDYKPMSLTSSHRICKLGYCCKYTFHTPAGYCKTQF